MIFLQVADSVAIREAVMAGVKAGMLLLPPGPLTWVITLIVPTVIGMLVGWVIHHFGVKKGVKIATKIETPTVENKDAPIMSSVKPETYSPHKS